MTYGGDPNKGQPEGTVNPPVAPGPAHEPIMPGGTAPAPAPSDAGGPLTPPQGDTAAGGAQAQLRVYLDQYGLGVLGDWAWSRYQAGASIDQIMFELYSRPEFKAIYPEYEVLAQKGRAQSVATLQAYRQSVVGLANQYGLDPNYLTNDRLSKLAGGEVSVAEVSRRFANAQEAVFSTPPEVRAELQHLYGWSLGDFVLNELDPGYAEPYLRQRWTAAQVSGAGVQAGFGALTAAEAEALAGRGVDFAGAQKGFGELYANRELFGALNAGEQGFTQEQQLGAEFGGDAQTQKLIEAQRARRLAAFAQGGGYATSQKGVVGVG